MERVLWRGHERWWLHFLQGPYYIVKCGAKMGLLVPTIYKHKCIFKCCVQFKYQGIYVLLSFIHCPLHWLTPQDPACNQDLFIFALEDDEKLYCNIQISIFPEFTFKNSFIIMVALSLSKTLSKLCPDTNKCWWLRLRNMVKTQVHVGLQLTIPGMRDRHLKPWWLSFQDHSCTEFFIIYIAISAYTLLLNEQRFWNKIYYCPYIHL
jgi:hypothetical protein